MAQSTSAYGVAVIGAGHAGCEAALAAARLGVPTVLLSIGLARVAAMPCNPAVGGLGKGQLVREVDALGGEMGRNADAAAIQRKVLNRSKGPAVRAPRLQTDKRVYESRMRSVLLAQDNLTLIEGEVVEVLARSGRVTGVRLASGRRLQAAAVVLATGTFLAARIIIGDSMLVAGRVGERSARLLQENLERMGLRFGRFQTATPPRVHRRSVDFSKMREEPGEEGPCFSWEGAGANGAQESCFVTYTTPRTHAVVKSHLSLSPIFTDLGRTHGPRNCPSIDRKVMNFPDKEHHPVFVEPEGRGTEEMYLQGLTTALPPGSQEEIVRATPGLEKAELMRPGYAVEYGFLQPDQLLTTLEAKGLEGFFSAGQTNGTTGYEEAAAQGLVAGANAALKVQGRKQLVLDRSQAYIGVLIDDLVTKGVSEPYRMLSSRAEYRLLLRADNAHQRLTGLGRSIGLLPKSRAREVAREQQLVRSTKERLARAVAPEAANGRLLAAGSRPIRAGTPLAALLRRPELGRSFLLAMLPGSAAPPERVLDQVIADIKYEGYLDRQFDQVERFRRLENQPIPEEFDFSKVNSLSVQGRANLERVRPRSLGQASRVSGVTPADISVILIHLKQG